MVNCSTKKCKKKPTIWVDGKPFCNECSPKDISILESKFKLKLLEPKKHCGNCGITWSYNINGVYPCHTCKYNPQNIEQIEYMSDLDESDYEDNWREKNE